MKKQYFGAKRITATPMTRADAESLLKRDIGGVETGEGYLVEYENGYQSWSPKKVFDAAYRPIDSMSFGLAIEALRSGNRVSRAGWNGKGMFLFAVPKSESKANQFSLKDIYPENAKFTIRPYINMMTVDGEIVPWVASQTDILADDWVTV